MPKPALAQCANPACGASLPAGSLAATCSNACRQAAYRARRKVEAVPGELTRRDRWVRRSASKVPLTVDGAPASSTGPVTWSSYDRAKTSTAGVGLGYVLAEGDGIVCVDLDHCLDGDELAPWAQAIVDAVGPTFTEISPSGSGLHLWCRGEVAHGRRIRRGEVAVEVYGRGRYIAMGRRYQDAPLKLAHLSLDALLGAVDSLA